MTAAGPVTSSNPPKTRFLPGEFFNNIGRLPPDEAAVRKAREAATGSDELHST
jgi:hypothetical protein